LIKTPIWVAPVGITVDSGIIKRGIDPLTTSSISPTG
jgi:hypothetical protein